MKHVIDVRKVAAPAAAGLLLVAARHPVDEPPFVIRPRSSTRPGRWASILSRRVVDETVQFRVRTADGDLVDVEVPAKDNVYTASPSSFTVRACDLSL